MKASNLKVLTRTPMIILFPLILAGVTYSISTNAVDAAALFAIFPIILIVAFILSIQHFTTFAIDEKGITGNLFSNKNFIEWDEFKYIGVGELHHLGSGKYSFFLYFSKVPLKNIYITDSSKMKQGKKYFYIMYKDGLLDEVLKHVDGSRIKDIGRIKNNPSPEKRQKNLTSALKRAAAAKKEN